MKNLFIVLLLFSACISFGASGMLYYCEHKGGINGGWLDSSFVFVADPLNPEFTQEVWEKQKQEFLSQLKSVSVDNSSAIVLELMRCPNNRKDNPRYKVENGQVVPIPENVLDITIPPGYTGVNSDGTLVK